MWGKQIDVEALIPAKFTADLPTIPVASDTNWKHLSGLELVDPNYGTPAWLDILLGGKVFRKAVLHCRRFGPTGAPSALKTCFGLVLNGEVKGESRQSSSHVCCISLDDNSLRRFWEIEDHNLKKLILSQEGKTFMEHFHKYHIRDKEGRFIVPLPGADPELFEGGARSKKKLRA